jgi:hypothetical protein
LLPILQTGRPGSNLFDNARHNTSTAVPPREKGHGVPWPFTVRLSYFVFF